MQRKPCPLPLADAWSNLEPALSPFAVETNARTSRAPPSHRPLTASTRSLPAPPKLAPKPSTPAHTKDLEVHGACMMQTTVNTNTYPAAAFSPTPLRCYHQLRNVSPHVRSPASRSPTNVQPLRGECLAQPACPCAMRTQTRRLCAAPTIRARTPMVLLSHPPLCCLSHPPPLLSHPPRDAQHRCTTPW
ncbi:hypothetical protein B0H13DRAFT_2369843 [Mycena leptocephala]|nr:hypothetical protein B0H13DRAFT_2369843 [Mycena leptocephala]